MNGVTIGEMTAGAEKVGRCWGAVVVGEGRSRSGKQAEKVKVRFEGRRLSLVCASGAAGAAGTSGSEAEGAGLGEGRTASREERRRIGVETRL